MSNEIMILLTINLEGVLSQEKEATTIIVEELKKSKKVLNKETKEFEMKDLVLRREEQHFQRKRSIASRKVKITEGQVEAMTSNDSIPEWYNAKKNQGRSWDTLSVDEKLKFHFYRMAYPNSYTYVWTDRV